jgi:hypothetical protein
LPIKKSKLIQATQRSLVHNAKFAIRDIYDAIVELVTNSDDRYQLLNKDGKIDIEIERRRGKKISLLKVRDFADGMDADTMEKKLSFMGGRESGMANGENVRGTHSRGAKDVAALGRVMFESITADGYYNKCEITSYFEFILHESEEATQNIRTTLGIPQGTGTLVTIEMEKTFNMPLHDTLKRHIERLVSLRGIINDCRREIILRDLNQKTEVQLSVPHIEGKERLKESFQIPGYPDVSAKLIIMRAKDRFERENERFRLGGIQIQSKRATHQSTLFDSALEADPHALWFYGRLVCPYIDDLCNEFDEVFESRRAHSELNPTYPLDPSRRSGLNREHPFVKELFGCALSRLRHLVEEERGREEHERSRIENAETRKRLNALEKAALDFMQDYAEDEEVSRDPDGKNSESRFMERGFALTPPFVQMIVGHSQLFWININQEAFPEIETGSTVQIECLSDDITSDKHYCGLEPHPTRDGVLRAVWKIKAINACSATGVKVRVGRIIAENLIEILQSEADKYKGISTLQFSKKRYSMRTDQKSKRVLLLAPIKLVSKPTPIQIRVDSTDFEISGQPLLVPDTKLCISKCELAFKCKGKEGSAKMLAKLESLEAEANIVSVPPKGAELSIKIEDIDLGSQRYRWRKNVLEIAARHPALKRYLGNKEDGFPGQKLKHFQVLIAEVVADAVCTRVVSQMVQSNPEEFVDADWDTYYFLYSKHLTNFLPIAHKIQCPDA